MRSSRSCRLRQVSFSSFVKYLSRISQTIKLVNTKKTSFPLHRSREEIACFGFCSARAAWMVKDFSMLRIKGNMMHGDLTSQASNVFKTQTHSYIYIYM